MSLQIKLRPSDADRWLICRRSPGYVAENLHRIPPEDKPYADEGAQAHEVAEQVLKAYVLKGLKPAIPPGVKIPREMSRHVLAYARHVQGLITEHCYLYVEDSVEVFYDISRKGKVDVALLYFDPSSHWRTITRVHIIDLKYGQGKSVQAEHNPQLSIYFQSLATKLLDTGYDFAPDLQCVLTVWQPRIAGEACERTWTVPFPELYQFTLSIAAVATNIAADPLKQPFAPGDEQCAFCPAKELCEARTRWLLGSGDDVIDLSPVAYSATPVESPDLLPDPLSLSLDQLARVLQVAPRLRKWLDGVEKYCEQLAVHHSTPIPHHKLVASSPKRRWRDSNQAFQFLHGACQGLGISPADLLSDPALVSPAQVEELLRDAPGGPEVLKQLRVHIIRPEGRPKLVAASDPHPEWRELAAEDEFENGLL